jgi:hypothetical protein
MAFAIEAGSVRWSFKGSGSKVWLLKGWLWIFTYQLLQRMEWILNGLFYRMDRLLPILFLQGMVGSLTGGFWKEVDLVFGF